VRDRLKQYPQVRLVNASTDSFYAGLVSFEPVHGDFKRVLTELAQRSIRVAGGPGRIRIATHIFNQPTELNAFFDALERGLRG
jgi:selenocysteine lyase/cysteine desulfurase